MRNCALLILLYISLIPICFAQSKKDTTVKKESNWLIYGLGGANYSYRNLTISASAPVYERELSYYNNQEEPYKGFTFGAGAIKKIKKNISFLFGFSYSKYAYRSIVLDTVEWNIYKWHPNSPQPSGYINNVGYPGTQTPYQLNSRYYIKECFTHVPIAIRYTACVEHKVSFITDIGVALGFLNEEFFIQEQGGTIFRALPNYALKSFFLSETPFLKLGASIKISNAMSFLLQAGFNYDLSGIGMYYPLTKHLYSSDLTMCFVYKLH